MNTLVIKNLTKYYGKIRGCENINLEVKKSEIFGFIGPNGAGKSTTIRCVMNLINKTSGEIYIDNFLVQNDNYQIKEKIGYLPSEIHLYEDLTVKELLDYNASFYKVNSKKKTRELVKELDLDLKKKVDELSLGNSKKLGIVLSLMHNPDLIILDEPTSGLDPLMQEKFYEIILKEQANGKTIFLSSHNLSEIKRLCDRVGIIKDGKMIEISDTDKLLSADFSIVKIYSKKVKQIIKKLKVNILDEKEGYIKIMYNGNVNDLIKVLSEFEIDKLLIEEPALEELFKHYYS